MSKYIDLAHPIAGRYEMKVGPIRDVLGLLDTFAEAHPDQVPGRTITEGEYEEIVEWCHSMYGVARGPLSAFGRRLVTVVPDPEPTNAEKLAKVLRNCGVLDHGDARGVLAAKLDRAGVKAPGGDE